MITDNDYPFDASPVCGYCGEESCGFGVAHFCLFDHEED